MKKIMVLAACSLALLNASAAEPAEPPATGAMRAVELAARAAPAGVQVTLAMEIKAWGRDQRYLYLNSEADYRDQRNITLDIAPAAEPELRRNLGGELDRLKGKHIQVRGTLRRVTVWLYANGEKTDKYYYQTHLMVSDSNQILRLE